MSEEFYIEEQREKALDEVSLILREMDRINTYRDTDPKRYCTGVETLIINLPRSIKYRAYTKLKELDLRRCGGGAVTEERFVLYDDLQNYIRDQLEKQKQIWVKKETKTYE